MNNTSNGVEKKKNVYKYQVETLLQQIVLCGTTNEMKY